MNICPMTRDREQKNEGREGSNAFVTLRENYFVVYNYIHKLIFNQM